MLKTIMWFKSMHIFSQTVEMVLKCDMSHFFLHTFGTYEAECSRNVGKIGKEIEKKILIRLLPFLSTECIFTIL